MEEFKQFIQELKLGESDTLKDMLIFSMLCFVVDLSHICLKFNFPSGIRTVYFILFVMCLFFYRNRYHRKKRLEKDKKKQDFEKQKILEHKIMQNYNLLQPVLNSFQGNNKIVILRDFVLKNSNKITLTQIPVEQYAISRDITSINSYINSYGYRITCTNLGDFVIAEITPEFLQILKLYFSKSN